MMTRDVLRMLIREELAHIDLLREMSLDDLPKKVEGPDACPECKGTGKYIGLDKIEDCLECLGTGSAAAEQSDTPDGQTVHVVNPLYVVESYDYPDPLVKDVDYVIEMIKFEGDVPMHDLPPVTDRNHFFKVAENIGEAIAEERNDDNFLDEPDLVEPVLPDEAVKDVVERLAARFGSTHVIDYTMFVYPRGGATL